MREIKFRIWDGESGKYVKDGWTYGYQIYANRNIQGPDPLGEVFEQFTGLRDKNGKEIYEGDILGWIAFGCPMDEFEELQRTYRLEVKWSCGGFDIPYANDTERTYEVIGNIHENPELLNKED